MNLWNFIHGTLGMHMYDFFAVLLLAVVLISATVHMAKEKQAEKTKNAADNQMPAARKSRRGD